MKKTNSRLGSSKAAVIPRKTIKPKEAKPKSNVRTQKKKNAPTAVTPKLNDLEKIKRLEELIVRPNTVLKIAKTRASHKRNNFLFWYGVYGLLTLIVTTVFWSYLSAKLQQSNADQLVNTYLFESMQTFREAKFPGTHSFILKWPLFLLIRLTGPSVFALQLFTVLISLATVACFASILYLIDRRPIVFGTVCLALASVLLYIPAQPYAGGILPVNMAMLANRNLEYIVYILSLVLLIRAPSIKSRRFFVAVLVLALLGLSDRLFLTLALGGGALMVAVYFVGRKKEGMKLGLRWLLATALAILGSLFMQGAINVSGITGLVDTSGGSPYVVITSLKTLTLGLVFGTLNVVTNFGANPAYDAAVVRHIPGLVKQRLLSATGIGYIINALTMVLGLYVGLRVWLATMKKYSKTTSVDGATNLAVMLMASSVAAGGAFIITDHYYVVDARYLTIILFATFISAVTWVRKRSIQPKASVVAILAAVLTIGVMAGVVNTQRTHEVQSRALVEIHERNQLVAQALLNHPVSVLVGDYWRVLPIKDTKPDSVRIMPLDGCTENRQLLTSQAWQADLSHQSFAYLLSFDKSLTNFPKCNLERITSAYGRPDSSILLAGTHDNPKELLLFYEKGIQKKSATSVKVQTILPITPEEVATGECADKTVMNIVAHQDDDLLFLSPDLIHDIKSGKCIRTVYLTAGDGGFDALYWQKRERGSQAAYSAMLRTNNSWTQRVIKLADGQFVTVVNPRGNAKVALIFMRLADGNVLGSGFSSSQFESLKQLESGNISQLHSVDGQSVFDWPGLNKTLVDIMKIYQPVEIKTHTWTNLSSDVVDHSDHGAAGRIAKLAYDQYDTDGVGLKYYESYSARVLPENVFKDDLAQKTVAFLMYAKLDPSVCHDKNECDQSGNYGLYLKRQYPSAPQ